MTEATAKLTYAAVVAGQLPIRFFCQGDVHRIAMFSLQPKYIRCLLLPGFDERLGR